MASTYKSVLDRVAEIPLAQADVKFDKIVESIVTLPEEKPDGSSVEIRTTDGEVQHYDEVVMTAPLGWLKRNKEAFEPPLPDRLAQAIDSISYGQLEKVYITFPTAFWQDDQPEQEDEHSNGNATTATRSSSPVVSRSTNDDMNSSHTSFFHWMHPVYASTTNPECWQQEAVNLASLSPPHAHPTLLYYTYGACSAHLTQLLSQQPASTHHSLLADFFQPYYSLLPHYSAGKHQPIAIHCTSWSTDALAGHGSYSNFQTGLTQADQDIECMRLGLPARHVWLAGEHTAPFIASGTVAGAYWAGEAVAQRLVEAYGKTRVDRSTLSGGIGVGMGDGEEEGDERGEGGGGGVRGKGEPRGM